MPSVKENDVFIDYETRSFADIKLGGHAYSRHDTTEILVLGWAVGEGKVNSFVPYTQDFPEELAEAVRSGGRVIAHNYAFEYEITEALLSDLDVRPEQWTCTMALAAASALPMSLELLSAYFGLSVQKDMAGNKAMMYLSKPRRPHGKSVGERVFFHDEGKLDTTIKYNKTDILVMRECFRRLRDLSGREREVFLLDQAINTRGVLIDYDAVGNALCLVKDEQKRLDAEMNTVTCGEVTACTQTARLTAWIQGRGAALDSLAKNGALDALEKREGLPPDVRRAIELRLEAAKSSTAKLVKMADMAALSEENRIRWGLQYHGATTGRWGGRGVQWQNFPCPVGELKKREKQIMAGDMLHRGATAEDLRARFPESKIMDIVPSSLRSLIIAPPGKRLLVADYSSVEARGIAWIAGQEDTLKAFREGVEIYKHAASQVYGIPITNVNKDQRKVGKVSTLACGYQGGVAAIQRFAALYRVEMTDEFAETIKTGWRERNGNIVQFWYDLENAAISAIRYPGRSFKAGSRGREVVLVFHGGDLYLRLPSKRVLTYPRACLRMSKTPWGADKPQVWFYGQDSLNKKYWRMESTYGGRLSENVTQAICRDIMAEAMIRLEASGYPIILSIHDELICEVENGKGSVEEMCQLMSIIPEWAAGFPIGAEGWEGERYGKAD